MILYLKAPLTELGKTKLNKRAGLDCSTELLGLKLLGSPEPLKLPEKSKNSLLDRKKEEQYFLR